ncbi:MAG: molybdopterin-containing oxidoreductase family protein [Desulfobulbus sp.]|jgi:anaerobic selenocysteine-containing dehydrogenase
MTALHRSVCPFDCPDCCGLLVEVEKGRAVRVTGDPDHPFTQGTLCPKMLRYEDTVHSSLRLTTPLLRVGPKGDAKFRPATWEEAIRVITLRWKAIIASHGADSILPYSYAGTMGLVHRNCGHAFFHRIGASRLTRTICAPAKRAGWRMVMGDTPAPHPNQAAQSDLIILWGINAAATNVHFLRIVREAKKKGAEVWLIDVYETPTAAAADRVIMPRPGTDGALALGMMHVLVREELTDTEFLREYVEGFHELVERILPEYDPARVSAITGLPAALIEELARRYAQAERPFIRLGSGLSRYGNGAMTVRCICVLPALVGAYRKPGAGLLASTSLGKAFARAEVTRDDFRAYNPPRLLNMNQLGDILTGLRLPAIMSLYVYNANPAAVTPDQNAVLRGLARKNLFTVVHDRFMTDTARWADVVLPACSSLETEDVYLSYGSYHLQRCWPVIPRVGESKSNWEVFALLADGMGLTEPYFHRTAEDMIQHLMSVKIPLRDNLDMDSFNRGLPVELVPPEDGKPFLTHSGKIEILNRLDPEPLPRYLPPHEAESDLPLALVTAPSMFGLNSSFQEQDWLREKAEGMQVMLHPEEARARDLVDGQLVLVHNDRGEVAFVLSVTERVPPGVAVAEGVWWAAYAPGESTVNALTSQRLTDRGEGSTLCDNRVDIKAMP